MLQILVYIYNTRTAFAIISLMAFVQVNMMNVMHAHNSVFGSMQFERIFKPSNGKRKMEQMFLFVFGNHIAQFIVSSVWMLWNDHIPTRNSRRGNSIAWRIHHTDFLSAASIQRFLFFYFSSFLFCRLHWFTETKQFHRWSIANPWFGYCICFALLLSILVCFFSALRYVLIC